MDHYKLLGIKQSASKDEIKKAYHKLALKYHPDKNKDRNAESKFRAVNEAYEILKDDQKRNAYDRFDLPVAQNRASSHDRSQSHRSRGFPRDDNYFTGASDKLDKEQRLQQELNDIRQTNSKLLAAANAELNRSSHKQSASDRSQQRAKVQNDILPEENDEDYEKIVIDRLRACESSR